MKTIKDDDYPALASQRRKLEELYAALGSCGELTRQEARELTETLTKLVRAKRAKRRTNLARQ